MKISKHFHLEEFTDSQNASRRGLKNEPSEVIKTRLIATAKRMDEIREFLGVPVIVSSGYRSPAVNKADGGSETSGHMKGYAVDWIAPERGTPLEVCNALLSWGLKDFDQLIMEGTWIHISFDPRNRGQVLTKTGKNKYRAGL